jgi:hypothetical protein
MSLTILGFNDDPKDALLARGKQVQELEMIISGGANVERQFC